MILLYASVAAAYLAAAWMEWQRLGQPSRDESSTAALTRRWLPALAIAGHAVLVVQAIFTTEGLDLSLANALSAVAGLVALFAWLGTLSQALPGVAPVALPVAAVGALLPAAFANPHRFSFTTEPWAALHIAVALTGYALLIVAAFQALVLMGLEKRLHRGLPEPAGEGLPPLLTLERFLFRLVGAGYVLLTLTLASGVLFSEQLFGRALTFTHKNVFSVLSWLVFGGVLYGRHRYGWRGRKALKGILAGSVLLLLAYIGSKFVLEVILKR
ncbi:MAG TPA: cytochrome c biogenesis protein CcsA [Casimicrobiaceae bacterium]|nr:cytochrome c biogenesis protein CcsA [Casimicrobiaceae bacterium]